LPELQDHVFGAEIINEPLDAAVTPAIGVPHFHEYTAPEGDWSPDLDADAVHVEIIAHPDNAGDVVVSGVVLRPGWSWHVSVRFDLGDLDIVVKSSGDKLTVVWFERVT